MTILSKACEPDNFELHKSLKLTLQIFKSFVQVFLNANLFLNQTLLSFSL